MPDAPSAGNLARLLLDHPATTGEPLVATIDEELSKGEFLAAAERVADELVGLGVRAGEAVALQLPGGPGMASGMFGTWLAGAVSVPVNARQPGREVSRVLEVIRPAAFVGSDGTRALEDATTYAPDTAFVTWTSGTTGAPKPILQTHSGYREILERVLSSIRKGSGSGPESGPGSSPAPVRPSPNLVPVSLALNAGIYNMLFGFMAGAAVVLMERFSPQDFATLVARYAVRSTVLPPAAMTMLTEADDVSDLAPLRYVRSITAPLSPLAARRFMDKFGVTVLNGYGQAEIGEVIGWTAEDARRHPEKLGAAGRPHAGVAIKVVDDAGGALGPGTPGQLLVRPPRMASGYAGPDGDSLADRVDAEGYVRTGDFATIDAEGFVWVEGRASDLINRGGNKVFPDQVEEVLLLLPNVREAAVAAVPDDRLGEVPVAFVVGDVSDDELVAVCRENLAPYKVPVAYSHVDAIPRSEVGKVLRRRLAEDWSRPASM